jgi:hypothetical protein
MMFVSVLQMKKEELKAELELANLKLGTTVKKLYSIKESVFSSGFSNSFFSFH